MTLLARLLNTVLFLAAWILAFMALHWLALKLLETQHFEPGQPLPSSFEVVVETTTAGSAPSYEVRRFQDNAQFKLAPGESLHLGSPAYDQMDHDPTGSCCFAFKVLQDGPEGQLVELHDDDMSYLMSRYRVRNGAVTPIAHRADFVLYYLGYFALGALLAWLATRPLRRRLLARARARATPPA